MAQNPDIHRGRLARTGRAMRRIDESSDAQLVTSIARYSEVALAEAYRRHGGAVYGLAKRVLNNPTEAEDVTQEVFLRLWNEPDKFDPDRGSLRSFLLAQSHGRAVDSGPLLQLAPPPRGPRGHASRGERATTCSARSGTSRWRTRWPRPWVLLPDEERRAIELAYFDGHTYREVATLLDQPEGTVKSRIRNGMRRLPRPRSPTPGCGAWTRDVAATTRASSWAPLPALDAVDGDEQTGLELHLETCPRCRAELDSLREAAATLGNSVEPLPEGLWSRIASQLPEGEAEDGEPPPMPSLAVTEAGNHGRRTVRPSSPFHAPSDGHRRRPRKVGVALLAATAVAAAAIAAVLGIGFVRADNRASDLQAQVSHQPSTVSGALQAPGRRLRLPLLAHAPGDGGARGRPRRPWLSRHVEPPVARPRGDLPAVGDHRRGITISLGLLGSTPHQAVSRPWRGRTVHRVSASPPNLPAGPCRPHDRRGSHRDCLTARRCC